VREFAADFEWEEDAPSALARRAAELGTNWRGYDEDLGLMLYDVFDVHERAAGFRWLHSTEIEALQAQRKTESQRLSAAARRAAAKTPLLRYEGRLVKPAATFFYARVQESTLDCHPDRVRFARQVRSS
jgi:hypothetical protein